LGIKDKGTKVVKLVFGNSNDLNLNLLRSYDYALISRVYSSSLKYIGAGIIEVEEISNTLAT